MKRSFAILASVAALMLAGLWTSAFAAGKEVTLTGDAVCAKCILKKSQTCQLVIQVNENGKKHNFWVTPNEVSKGFKEDVCAAAKKVVVTGSTNMLQGKRQLTLSKISLAK
jgi:hypothetical protein